MRLIDADAFKEYIKDGIDGLILPKDQAVKVIAITKSFLKDIDEQPTIEIPRVEWIPCSERLPQKSGWYAVTVKKYGRVTIELSVHIEGEPWCADNAVAWMPLPKPYEKEVNDNGRKSDS